MSEDKSDELVCACCKSTLDSTDSMYTKISCGHEYHYDCIYDAFIYNRKRNTNILECPYCRQTVTHIDEKDGFDFDITIHRGIQHTYNSNWSKLHYGNHNCWYKMGDLFCNKYFTYGNGKDQKYCNIHKNHQFIGSGFCPIQKGQKYCNTLCDNGKKYCFYHAKYESSLECCHIYEKGTKKGQICKKLTMNNNPKCTLHINHINVSSNKTCIAILKKGKNTGNICGKKGVNDTCFCKSHSPLVNELTIISV